MVLPECRWMWQGIEAADSLVLNPHKWLGAAFDCSVYLVVDPQHLVRVMSTNPSYLQSSVDARVKNLRDWGVPLGRRFRALKLWCLIREQGVAGGARPGGGAGAGGVGGAGAAGRRGRGPRPPHPRVGRTDQPLRRGLSHAGGARRAVDGSSLDRSHRHRA